MDLGAGESKEAGLGIERIAMPMDRMEAFRAVFMEVGDLPAEQLSQLIADRYGVKIEPAFIPIFRESLRDHERLLARKPAAPMPQQQP